MCPSLPAKPPGHIKKNQTWLVKLPDLLEAGEEHDPGSNTHLVVNKSSIDKSSSHALEARSMRLKEL